MKILITDNRNPNALESCYARHISDENELFKFAESELHVSSTVGRVYRRLTTVFRELISNYRLLQRTYVCKPQVLWIFKGLTVWSSTVRKVRSLGVFTVNYNADHPFEHCSRGSGNRNVANAATFYDLHMTYSRHIASQLREQGLAAVTIPFGHDVSEATYQEISSTPEKLSVGFIGAPDEKRANSIRTLLKSNLPVEVYGPGWSNFLLPNRQLTIHPPVFGLEMYRIIRQHRLQLNLFRPHNIESHNMRSFEVPASGGILLAENSLEHREFFDDPTEVRFFSFDDEMVNKAKAILELPTDESERIRNRARMRVESDHYSYRAKQAMNEISYALAKKSNRN